tara:strand:+ start:7390 stop:7737 length:348 start_codon:yes stop_codon:yes gene_type:complete
MSHPSKQKGNGYERELVNLIQDSGMKAKRAYASNGESLGHHAEVDLVFGNADYKVQAKRRKKIADYLQVGEHVDFVVFRQDRGDSLVLMDLYRLLDILKALENEQVTDGNSQGHS